jgi:hypothetical protein
VKWLLLIGGALVLGFLWLRRNGTTDAGWRGVPPAAGYSTDKRVYAPQPKEPRAPESIVGGGCNYVTDGKASAGCRTLGRAANAVADWWNSGYSDDPAVEAAKWETMTHLNSTAPTKPIGFR